MSAEGHQATTTPKFSQLGELLGRGGIVAYFTFAATIQCVRIRSAFDNWQRLGNLDGFLQLVSTCAVFLFLMLIILTSLFRHKPLASSEHLESRISALAGTFLLVGLAIMPEAELPPVLTIAAFLLIILGALLSAYVLIWLGRSFSIMAQARQLITAGPYAIVRHPLYLVEEIIAIGVLILHFSWQAVLLVIVHWALQVRRMYNEECILKSQFPEYDAYAKVTPRVIPNFVRKPRLKPS